jgi:RNA polymerase sigma-70 factor (ECF subfamily)
MEESVLDEEVKRLLAAHQPDDAVQRVLEKIGPEVGGYLASVAIDGDEAAEAFSAFAEDVWRGLSAFRFESSLRTWCYVIARRALARYRRGAARRRERQVPLSALGPASRIAAEIRSQTTTWRKTEVKDKVRALREGLKEEERELLMLRVDRKLSFAEIARVLSEEGKADDAALKKSASTLRKRFERLKERIRILAQEEGLL